MWRRKFKMPHHHNLDSLATIALRLPVLNGGLLAAETTQPPHPEDAGTEVSLSCQMIEEKPRFPGDVRQIEAVLHDEEEIDIVRLALLRDKRAVDNEPGQRASRARRIVDVLSRRLATARR